MDTFLPVVSNEELQAKYQRLGQEYQKARAQITVLKKAVIDEQAVNKLIQDGSTQRDQTIRKYEQEIDSLNFRNSQLSKRVEILQTELAKYESKGIKPVKQPNTQTSISFIHEQELQMKIAENESLHKQLQEANIEHETRTHQLASRLEELERNKEDYEKAIEDCNSKNNVVIQKLKEEQQMLDAKLNKQAEDLKIANMMTEKYKKQFKENTNELQSKLDNSSKLMQEKIPFIDSQVMEYNKLNIPVCDAAYQHKAQSVIELITNNFIAFLGSFSDYHTYLEQRLQVFSADIKKEDISIVNAMFSSHLLKNAVHSRKLQHTLKALHEQSRKETFILTGTLTSLKDISVALKKYYYYLSLLMPYRILSIEAECRSSMWSESIEKCNNDILNEEKKVVTIFSKLASYINVIVTSEIPSASRSVCITNLSLIFSNLNKCLKRMCEHYVAKSADEHDLPTYTDRLRTTDDFLLSTVYSLQSSSSKIDNLFNEHLSFLATPHLYKRKGLPSDPNQEFPFQITLFNNKATSYIESLLKAVSPSIPYSSVIENNRSLMTSTNNHDDVSKQIVSSQECIAKLEQEKEHWILEHKLLKAKYDKEQKKAAMIGEELKNVKLETLVRSSYPDGASAEVHAHSETPSSQLSSPTATDESVQLLGTMEVSNRGKSGSTDSDQETLVKEYLYNRISELTKQLQIVLADKNKQKLTNSLMESKKKAETLQDELETTKRSYEEQLGMFSDHLCGMNDKLTSQKDQIDELKTGGSTSASHNFGIFQLPGRKK